MLVDKDIFDGVVMVDGARQLDIDRIYKIVGELSIGDKDFLVIEHEPKYMNPLKQEDE